MILCLTIVGSSFIGLNVFNAKATEITQNTKSLEVYKNIKADNSDYKISAIVSYDNKQAETTPTTPDNDDIQLTIDQNDFTTTESLHTITGSYHCNGEIIGINYSIKNKINDKDEIKEGNASINENKWTIKDLHLKPGYNEILVTLTTTIGKTKSSSLKIYYDDGEQYTIDESHIKTDDLSDTTYMDNILLVYFEDNVTEKRKQEIINSINGKIVGRINVLDQIQVEVSARSLSELEELISDLEKYDEVVLATYDEFTEIESQSVVPQDNWDNNHVWDEANPNGNNWWVESTQLLSAWRYDSYFNNINIGIIDSGFDTSHEDLNIKFPNKKSENNNRLDPDSHGTHVAGIIGATQNNGKGITGVVNDVDLFCLDRTFYLFGVRFENTNSVAKNIATLVESADTKVINFSQIWSKKTNDIKTLAVSFRKLLSKKYDFVVVQAAGNKNKNVLEDNATFALISEKYYNSKNSKISIEDIENRIIVVGNAEQVDDEYRLHQSSNFGNRIDIVAPGTDIYSTINNNDYMNKTGTSMAAPIVTGIAGLVWSINEDFTGEEVKDIVCNSVDSNLYVNNNPEVTSANNTYKLVNAKLSVEEALKRTHKDIILVNGCITGKVYDIEEKIYKPIQGTIYKVTDQGSREKYSDFSYDGINDFEVELPVGTYIFEILPISEDYETTSVFVTLNDRIVRQLGSLYLVKKTIEEPQPEESDFLYRIENDEVIITGYKGTGGDILIPFYIEDKPVVMIDEKAFYENNTITSVTFDGNLDSIGSYAFAYCDSLKSVSIKGIVTDIKSYAFNECQSLTSFSANEGVINISQGAFASCKKLSDFGIQNKIEYIGNMAFFSCESLYDFDYPKGANVNKYAFMGTNTKYKNDWIKI